MRRSSYDMGMPSIIKKEDKRLYDTVEKERERDFIV